MEPKATFAASRPPVVSGLAWRSLTGLQANGVFGAAWGLSGVQLSGVFSMATEFRGVQASGVFNTAVLSGGAQVAGVLNVAESVRGVQISGLVNIARTVRGSQIGVINIADESRGVPVGLFNYVRSVGLAVDTWKDETDFAAMVVRSGNHRVPTYLGLAARPWRHARTWAGVFGLGVEMPISPRVLLAADLLSYSMPFVRRNAVTGDHDYEHLLKGRALLNVRLTSNLGVFAGPSYNLFAGDAEKFDLTSTRVYDQGRAGSLDLLSWPGFVAGVRFSSRRLGGP